MTSGDGPTMSDTATPHLPEQSGVFASIGLLMRIGGHLVLRRHQLSPSTHN